MVRYIFALLLFALTSNLHAVTYGSDTTPSRPARCYFPAVDTNNIILGFAALDSGFLLEDYTTKCTYNALFPIAGDIALTGGNFYLLEDLVLSNDLNFVTASGLIDAGSRSLELPCLNVDYSLPSIGALGAFSPRQLSSPVMTAAVYSMDWNYNGQYVLAGSAASASTELQLYYFDGATLTATTMTAAGGELSQNVNSIHWFPTDNFVVVSRNTGSGNEILAYYKRFNGSFSLQSSVAVGLNVVATRWHPSGSVIIAGGGGGEVGTYPFTQSTGQIGALITFITLGSAVNRDAFSVAPGGNFLAVGNAAVAGNTLNIVSVNSAGTVALSTGANPGVAVQTVDWCPTGTYIAVGLAAVADSLRVYAHDVGAGTVTEKTSARVGEAKSVNSVRWDPTGTFLMVGMTTGTAPQFRIFYFDKSTERLVEVYREASVLNTINTCAWAPSSNFFSFGLATSFNVTAFGIQHSPLWLNNTCFVLNANTNLYLPLVIKNNCKINGRGKRLTLQNGSEIVVRPGASLILEDVELAGVGKSNVRCLTDAASITLCHAQLDLAHNLTVTRGLLLLQETVAVTGTNALILSSPLATIINSGSMLYIGSGATLQYAPPSTRRDLLSFTDPTSVLYLDSCSLVSTRTGLQLSEGTLFFDDAVTLSSQALYAAEGMSLASTMTIEVRSGANVKLYGYVRVD